MSERQAHGPETGENSLIQARIGGSEAQIGVGCAGLCHDGGVIGCL